MKRILLLTAVLLASLSLHGQGVRFDSSPLSTTTQVAGVTGLLTPITNGTIHWCSAPANAVPCTNFATTYTDSTLTVSCNTNTPVVLQGTNICVAGADSFGNFGVWAAPGQYAYTVTAGLVNYGPFYVTIAQGSVLQSATFKGPTPWIDVKAYGAVGDCLTDDSSAIQAALSVCSAGHRVYVPQSCYVASSSASVPSGCTFFGDGGGPAEGGAVDSGPYLKWTGAINSDVIKLHDVAHSKVLGVNVDCNNVSGCNGIHYDSDNSPTSSHVEIGNLSILNFHFGIVAGETSGTASTNNFQSDVAWIHDIQYYGKTTDTTAECLHVNSQNALDQTTYERTNCQFAANYVHIVRGPIQTFTMKHNNGGNMIGAKTAFQFDSTNIVAPNMEGNETEGSSTHAVIDQSTGTGAVYSAVWNANQFNAGDVQISGKEYIAASGNTGGAPGTWVVSNNAFVSSFMEPFSQWSGNVFAITAQNSTVAAILGNITSTKSGNVPNAAAGVINSCTSATLCTQGQVNVGGTAITTSGAGTTTVGVGAGGSLQVTGAGATLSSDKLQSTIATGTAPLVVASTTPVANLNASPVTYNLSGSQIGNPHEVIGTCVLGTSCAVTFTGAAVFTSSSTYSCTANDTSATAAVKVAQASGSSVTFTGTGTDGVGYRCVGN